MRNKPKLLKLAERDLEGILEYKSLLYPGTAGRFIDDLEEVLENIAQFPLMYPVYENNPRYRRAIVNEYLLFYRVVDKKPKIRIYRILHSKRDLVKLLSK